MLVLFSEFKENALKISLCTPFWDKWLYPFNIFIPINHRKVLIQAEFALLHSDLWGFMFKTHIDRYRRLTVWNYEKS